VLGATKPVPSFVKALDEGKEGGRDYLSVKAEWKGRAGLMTIDDAIKASATTDKYKAYTAEVGGKFVSLQERRAIAKKIIGEDIYFDWELPRTPIGQYMWQWSTKAVIDRCILAAPLGDLSWSRQGMYTNLLSQDFLASY
jgi:isocitrate lyase